MSIKMGEKPILCDTKSSSGKMESIHCNWNGAKGDQVSSRSRPMSDTLSKLAQLITCIEYKSKPQTSSSNRKNYSQESSDLKAFVRHQQREHPLQKLHRCQNCGQKFALLSSLQLHECPRASSVGQTCRGIPTRGASCPSCGTEPSGPSHTEDPFYHDSGPYACAPCGQAFSHKQELLYHQQAGGCQPAKTLKPPSPSYTSLPPSPPNTKVSLSACTLCSRTFRSSAGLSCHMRFSHTNENSSPKKKTVVIVSTMKRKKRALITSMLFPCRSCDKSFPKTSLLHRHRKEEHRRDIKVRNTLKNTVKITRQRRKGETYPCLHCGKEFLHHLTRWAHFRHFSAHHQAHLKLSGKSAGIDATGLTTKKAKELRVFQEAKRGRGRPRTKNRPNLTDIKQEKEEETDELQDSDEDAEYPCTSCEKVFGSRAALFVHEEVHEEVHKKVLEEVHQSADTCGCCSVCTGGIPLTEIPEDCEKKVYHCVPCAEAFMTLDAFLEHCQKHLLRDNEDEFSDD